MLSKEGHSRWRNLRSNLTRFLSREIPYAEILARYGNREVRVQSDLEGYFEAHLHFPEGLQGVVSIGFYQNHFFPQLMQGCCKIDRVGGFTRSAFPTYKGNDFSHT